MPTEEEKQQVIDEYDGKLVMNEIKLGVPCPHCGEYILLIERTDRRTEKYLTGDSRREE